MNIPEGHYTITRTAVDEDYDHGPCRAMYIDELGLLIWLYDNDPTRISLHHIEEEAL